ncbi:hypothetical protein HD806DRAFT_543952 [Xylariaceae sp. AK1471]|nr:hypothetical protein HD806DRAFT_543952 [Xylariaceae sp. AK1471]
MDAFPRPVANPQGAVVVELWNEVKMQLDHVTRIVKMSTSLFNRLGHDGEEFFKEEASVLLGEQVEFFVDGTNANRVYLGSRMDIQLMMCTIEDHPNIRFPVIRPDYLGQASSAFPEVESFNTRSAMMTRHVLDYQAPLQAPVYPVLSRSLLAGSSNSNPPGPQQATFNNNDDDEDDNEPARVKRPENSFMLYRKDNCGAIKAQFPGIPNGQVSRIIADRWNGMSEAAQKPWRDEAARLKAEFNRLHPDYKYQPDRKAKSGKRPRREDDNDLSVPRDVPPRKKNRKDS